MQRRKTRTVWVGKVAIGSEHPIRVQSMTTSPTQDVKATVEQILKLADYGCELVRVTVQGMQEAKACEEIKNRLLQKGYTIPLVADIHFFPAAAMRVVDFVDKVRINPGNYVDKRATFRVIEYDKTLYQAELQKLEEKFTPLVEKCKKLKKVLRIGTNHGSLSDRILNRYGDTPQGIVESALEFARICRKQGYHDLIFSMKSSNPKIMIEAYRLMSSQMKELGWDYPFHIGVTEAGQGEEGRVKSAVGIGSLLLEGIGDTIRVSLTEDPWQEIDPCRRLISLVDSYSKQPMDISSQDYLPREIAFSPGIPLHPQGSVGLTLSSQDLEENLWEKIGWKPSLGSRQKTSNSADLVYLPFPLEKNKKAKQLFSISELITFSPEEGFKIYSLNQAIQKSEPFAIEISKEPPSEWEKLLSLSPSFLLWRPPPPYLYRSRKFFSWLKKRQISLPVILRFSYSCSKEDVIIHAAAEIGALLCENLGEGIWIEGPYEVSFLRSLSLQILQACRKRQSKTDFISCPSCGRTLFDLQQVTRRIQAKTAHLPGVKIAIMGCIVNGPGEMADADFGYVGSKPGKIDLYIGKKCVEKDIDSEKAEEKLIQLIQQQGLWVEPAKNP